jgi:hypothetical protein
VREEPRRLGKELREAAKILLFCVTAAITYGILQDLVTTRVCVEYFTIGHPPVFGTDDPTLLALGWGVAASWWVGLLLGLPLIVTARVGTRPPLGLAELVKPIGILMALVGISAAVAGLAGYALAEAGMERLTGFLATRVPAHKHAAFLADAYTHLVAYAVGFLGGLAVCGWVLRERGRRLQRETTHP